MMKIFLLFSLLCLISCFDYALIVWCQSFMQMILESGTSCRVVGRDRGGVVITSVIVLNQTKICQAKYLQMNLIFFQVGFFFGVIYESFYFIV